MFAITVYGQQTKCHKYWPDAQETQTYGAINVTNVQVVELTEHTERTFNIWIQNSGGLKSVRQFQYTAWPDHGVPDHPAPFLRFVQRVMSLNPQNVGPVIAHCSAGVGRTGTFIALWCQIMRIKAECSLDILGFVKQMRCKRTYMMQTEVLHSMTSLYTSIVIPILYTYSGSTFLSMML